MLITLTCLRCQQDFTHDAQGGRRPDRCPPCRVIDKREKARVRNAVWRAANPQRAKDHANKSNRKRLADPEHLRWKREDALRRAYGMEPADFAVLLDAQGGVCAICGGPPNGPGKRLHVDHCHDSKRVRGLLCAKCNTALGLLGDDYDRVRVAADYLRYGGEWLAIHRRIREIEHQTFPHPRGAELDAEIEALVDRARQLIRSQFI